MPKAALTLLTGDMLYTLKYQDIDLTLCRDRSRECRPLLKHGSKCVKTVKSHCLNWSSCFSSVKQTCPFIGLAVCGLNFKYNTRILFRWENQSKYSVLKNMKEYDSGIDNSQG